MIYIIFYLICANKLLNNGCNKIRKVEEMFRRLKNKQIIKSLNAKPVIKNIDVEAIKKEFSKSSSKKK